MQPFSVRFFAQNLVAFSVFSSLFRFLRYRGMKVAMALARFATTA
jgi:hypothetical protein